MPIQTKPLFQTTLPGRLMLLPDGKTIARVIDLPGYGGEITDAMRIIPPGNRGPIQGDGLPWPDNSTGFWRERANLIANGGFDSVVGPWFISGANSTLTVDTNISKFGNSSGKYTCTVAGGSAILYSNIVTGSPIPIDGYAFSAWLYATGGSIGKAVQFQFNETGGAVGDESYSTINPVLVAGWQRVATAANIRRSDRTQLYLIILLSGAAIGDTIYIDGAQFEACNSTIPAATPYIHTAGATASRTFAQMLLPTTFLPSPEQGWVATRYRTHDCGPQYGRLLEGGTAFGSSKYLAIIITGPTYGPSGTIAMGRGTITDPNPNNATQSLVTNDGDMVTAIGAWTPTQVMVEANGNPFTTHANTDIPTDFGGYINIGRDYYGAALVGAEIKWQAYGIGTLTNADASLINSWGNRRPFPGDFPGSAQCTGVWWGDMPYVIAA